MKKLFVFVIASFSSFLLMAGNGYQLPPKEIQDLLLASPAPTAVFNPDASRAAVLVRDCQFRKLSEIVSADERKVGGVRISARNFSETRFFSWFNHINILDVETGTEKAVSGIPGGGILQEARWSADGNTLCFINLAEDEVELYAVDASKAEPVAVKINEYRVNSVFGHSYSFLPDGRILYKSVPSDIAGVPVDGMPEGPVIQRGNKKKTKYETFQDLIKNQYDEKLYEYLCTSVFALYDGRKTDIIGKPGIFRKYSVSPDGRFVLYEAEKKPFSYTAKHGSFPSAYVVMEIDGKNAVTLKDPEIDKRAGKDSLPVTGRWQWRTDRNSTLAWVERVDSTYSVLQCDAPFDIRSGRRIASLQHSFESIHWGTGDLAVLYEKSKKEKMMYVRAISPDDSSAPVRNLFSYSTATDTVGNAPVYGKPYTKLTATGDRILFVEGKGDAIFFVGGNRPDSEGDNMWFLDRYDLKKGKMAQIWTAEAPFVSSVVKILSAKKGRVSFVSRRESNKVFPQYCIIDSKNGKTGAIRQLTSFENSLPQLQGVIDRFITYTRADGVRLSSRLYLPEGYDPQKDGRLPLFMWTYPYEYQSKAEAEKKRESRYTFDTPGRTRHMGWATQGYAVLQGFSMPIIAPTVDGQPNDDFMRQLVMNAEAAINCLDSLGIADRERVAVGGLSYGSFMTTNLMCHTKLFKAGLAMSGAYNRTLTPFCFQNEERTYWEIEKIYHDMSPFNYADSLSGHILFLHGTMDENTGTHPIQSERMYFAVIGNGGDADYIQLPYEGHSYIFVENIMQMYREAYDMFDKFLKKKK